MEKKPPQEIKELLRKSNLSTKEIHKLTGISISYIDALRRGSRGKRISVANYMKLKAFL